MRWCTLATVLLALSAGPGCGRKAPTPEEEQTQRWKDAETLAQKLWAHYRPEGLEQFTFEKPGTFEPLLQAGVLAKENGRTIDRHGFRSFEFCRSLAYSRRYQVSFNTGPDCSLVVTLNHRGEPISPAAEEQDQSSDLAADVAKMWERSPTGRASQEAIWAASRVFNTVNLVGMNRKD